MKKMQEKILKQQWIYDLVYEHLTSPIWKIAIMEFVDENCFIFDEEDLFTVEQEEKFNQFKELISSQFDNMLNEYGLAKEQLAKQIILGLTHEGHKQIFYQIIAINDYNIFRKQMLARNKELEYQALEEINKQDKQKQQQQQYQQQQEINIQQPGPEFDQEFELKRMQLEKEKAELELAIEMSKKAEEEQKRLMENDNEDVLKQILEQSLFEYNELQKKLEIVQKKESELRSQPQYKQSEIFKSIKSVKYPSFSSYNQRQEEQNHQKKESDYLDSKIVHQYDFQNQDFNYAPPVIGRVSSELIEEGSQVGSDVIQEQRLKIQHQKEVIIKRKNEMNRSELLKLEQGKKPFGINQSQYQWK